jgi:aminoglycoside 3-N-acetyltransferase I
LSHRAAAVSHRKKTLDVRVKRLGSNDQLDSRRLFTILAEVFEETCAPLSDTYLNELLRRRDFWALAAFVGDDIIGGVTAYALPMTRAESTEMFVFDVAVQSLHRKKGIGRRLLTALRKQASEAGIHELFIAADNEDEHALDFYRRLGGVATLSTVFVFSPADQSRTGR